MGQVRNKSGIDLFVPELGRTVKNDEVVPVPDDRLEAFTSQTIWADETPKKKEAH